MAQLLVRNLTEDLVKALKQRAAKPNVGEDQDFARKQSDRRG